MAMAFSSQCCCSRASSRFQHAHTSGSIIMPSFVCGTTRSQQQLSGCRLSSGALVNKARLVLKGRSIRKPGGVVCEVGTLAEIEAVPLDDAGFSKIPASQGIYAIYDKQGDLQFVGMSRRVATSVQGHVRDLPELCGSVKVAVVDAVDRDGLRQAWQAWVEEHIKSAGSVPPGNAPGNSTWAAKRRPAKQDLKLKPSQNTQLTVPLEKLIDKVVREFGVVAFIKGSRTAPQCGFSHRVLTILNEQGVEYETVNVLDEEHNSGVREAIKTYSQWPTIPQVFVGGEFVGGADVMTEMAENGEIKKLFTELKAKN